jgi:hypothetical protein
MRAFQINWTLVFQAGIGKDVKKLQRKVSSLFILFIFRFIPSPNLFLVMLKLSYFPSYHRWKNIWPCIRDLEYPSYRKWRKIISSCKIKQTRHCDMIQIEVRCAMLLSALHSIHVRSTAEIIGELWCEVLAPLWGRFD